MDSAADRLTGQRFRVHLRAGRDVWTGDLRFEPGRLVGMLESDRDGAKLPVAGDVSAWVAEREHLSATNPADFLRHRSTMVDAAMNLRVPVSVRGVVVLSLGDRHSLRCRFRDGSLAEVVVTYPDGSARKAIFDAEALFSTWSEALRDVQ